jgi:hypothetical protein
LFFDELSMKTQTGADSDGDGRSVVAADFRNNGMQDLIVRQAGGGALLLFENNLPRKHYLKVTLQGRSSNRQGIGARLTGVVKGQRLVRELFPANSFFSQAPNIVHFGLADAELMDTLTIRWPTGKAQILTSIKGDRHILVDEGKEGNEAIRTIMPGQTMEP